MRERGREVEEGDKEEERGKGIKKERERDGGERGDKGKEGKR
jgi:hypothetical protein